MQDEPRQGSRWRWLVPPLALVATAAVTAAVLLLLVLDPEPGEEAPPPAGPATETPASTTTPGAEQAASPDTTEIPAATQPATPVATATEAASPDAPASPTPSAEATATPTLDPRLDYPDLVVREVFSRLNQLYVVVANAGDADADGLIEVSVDGGPPQPIDTGKALRPGDLLEYPLEGAYVQRRAQVVVSVQPSVSIVERNAGNNVFVGIVEPDVPNDLAIIDVTYGGSGPHLIATLRNRSPIPLRGEVTIGIREIAPEDRLLLRETRELEIDRGATQAFEFPGITSAPLESVQVLISTDAINDADESNDALPRWGPR